MRCSLLLIVLSKLVGLLCFQVGRFTSGTQALARINVRIQKCTILV